jgi:hypothetical protein
MLHRGQVHADGVLARDRAVGECNAITNRRFGHGGLTFVSTLETACKLTTNFQFRYMGQAR